jgi:virulence-associated protein VagC
MPIAKVFKSGNSQAIRLPKEFRLKVSEVELIRQGNDILIRQPKCGGSRGCSSSGLNGKLGFCV